MSVTSLDSSGLMLSTTISLISSLNMDDVIAVNPVAAGIEVHSLVIPPAGECVPRFQAVGFRSNEWRRPCRLFFQRFH